MHFDPQSSARPQAAAPLGRDDGSKRGHLTIGMVLIAVLGAATTGIWLWTQEKAVAQAGEADPAPQVAQVVSPNQGADDETPARRSPLRPSGDSAKSDNANAAELAYQESRWAYERGLRSMAKGHHAKAATYLQEAIRLDSGFADAHYSLGLAYSRLGDHRGAMHQRRRLQKLDPALAGLLLEAVN